MTDDEIRIAVAECCGWTDIHFWEDFNSNSGLTEWRGKHLRWCGCVLPNYPADLNACAEMEKTLSDDEYTKYEDCVWDIQIEANGYSEIHGVVIPKGRIRSASPTASQRCEAFLRVKGKWTETTNAAVANG